MYWVEVVALMSAEWLTYIVPGPVHRNNTIMVIPGGGRGGAAMQGSGDARQAWQLRLAPHAVHLLS